jgi:hypothetical protein
MRMLHTYWRENQGPAEALFIAHPSIKRAVEIMVAVWTAEQRHEEDVQADGWPLYRRAKVKPAPKQPWTGFAGLPRAGKGSKTAYVEICRF